MANVQNLIPGKKGGEFRSILTREAYLRNAQKCERVMDKIIEGALELDAVCLKIFAQAFITRAPQEVQMTMQSDQVSQEKIDSIVKHLISKGMSEEEAGKKIIEMNELLKMVKD